MSDEGTPGSEGVDGGRGPGDSGGGPGDVGAGLGSRAGSPARGASAERSPGWREVLLVSAGVVALVLGAAIVTGLLPTDLQRIVFHEPVLIGLLAVGTIVVLLGVAGRRPPVE